MQNYPPYETQKKGTPTWVIVLGTCGGCGCLAVLAFGIFTFYISRNVVNMLQKMSEEMKEAHKDFKVQDYKLVKEKDQRYLVGSAKNISPANRYHWVNINFILTDAAGAELDSTQASRDQEIKPGEVWKFKVPVTNPQAVKVKIGEINGMKVSPEWDNMDPETKRKLEELKESMRQSVPKEAPSSP